MKIGDRFGRLVYIEDLGMVKYGNFNNTKRMGVFQCDCGNKKEIACANVKRGNTTSCGCYRNEMLKTIAIKHNLSKHPLYKIWSNIKDRCYNEDCKDYLDYGGRFIKMCNEWKNDFICFYDWAINAGWNKGLHIDRIDNNGNYEPSNCHFIMSKENCAIGKRRMRKTNKSGFVGVSFNSSKCYWVSKIQYDGKEITIMHSQNIQECIEARISKEIELFGEQKTNFHYDRNNFKKD